MAQGKRVHVFKVSLTDAERDDVMKTSAALDMAPGEVLRRAAMQSMRGTLGLAEQRAKYKRGEDSSPDEEDFIGSGFGDLI